MRRLDALALMMFMAGACGDGYVGPVVRLSGNFNAWAKGDRAAALTWDGSAAVYRGTVELPGDSLALQVYSPYTDDLFGQYQGRGVIPAQIRTTDPGADATPIHLETPLWARYQVEFAPAEHRLHVDFSDDAETTPGL